jgi:hypothetical protein
MFGLGTVEGALASEMDKGIWYADIFPQIVSVTDGEISVV